MSPSSCRRRRSGPLLMFIPLLVLAARAMAAYPVVEKFDAYEPDKLLAVENGSFEKGTVDGGPVLRWHINMGQTSLLSMRTDHPLFDRLRYYDRFEFDLRIASGAVHAIDVYALGHVSGPRQSKVYNWLVATAVTRPRLWHTRRLNLGCPNWFPWDNPDGEGAEGYFRFEAMSIEPDTVVELRNIRLSRTIVALKPDWELPITWPMKTQNADGSVTYSMAFQVHNASGRPTSMKPEVLSQHQRFKVAFKEQNAELKANQVTTFNLTATMAAQDIAATPELYEEPLRVAFTPAHAPEGACLWDGHLVRPLSRTLRRQVVLSQGELQQVRKGIQAGDAKLKEALGYDRIVASADAFLSKRLDALPHSRAHVHNGYPSVPGSDPPRPLLPGTFMPEILDPKGEFREVGTNLAGVVWKEYMGLTGHACEDLAMAYLLTGEEKYAAKAIELFRLYAQQFTESPWTTMNDAPWYNGPPFLGSSRISLNSTYGSNWYMKGHCRLASAVAESPSWKEEERERVYRDFILPYATEIAKFPGGISNMTDITNHNLLLLGLAFDDAHIVRWATRGDCGLVSRLYDIDRDGFSSEGRPLNYHFGAMQEYLPSITYLENSGLKIDYPKERLLAAIRMPYERATLSGRVPTTGDCGRAQGVGLNPLADCLIAIFPEEKWLFEIGAAGTVSKKLWLLREGRAQDAEAWRKLLETKPRLFRDAGMAILRSGTTPEAQVMATLDYGRNVFHAALDRNQVTLAAFGLTFTHGPGSLYNVGSGGMTRATDARLDTFGTHGSLGQNVILVDMLDQMGAVGRLLAWSPKEDFQVAVSRVDGIRPGVSHTRGLVLTQGIVVMLDRVESDQEHTYDFVYHNLGELAPPQGWQVASSGPLGRTANYENLVEPRRLTGEGPLRLTWDLTRQQGEGKDAAAKVALALWQLPLKGSEVYFCATGMNNPNTATIPDAAPTLIHRVRARTVEFFTVLEPHKGAPRVTGLETTRDGHIQVILADNTRLSLSMAELVKQHAIEQ